MAAGPDLAGDDDLLHRQRRDRAGGRAADRGVRRAPGDDRRGGRRRRGAGRARAGRAAVAALRRLRGVRRRLLGVRAGPRDDRRHALVPRPSLGRPVGGVDRAVGRWDRVDAGRQTTDRRQRPCRVDAVAGAGARRRHRAGDVVPGPAGPRARGMGTRRPAPGGRCAGRRADRDRVRRGGPEPLLPRRHLRLHPRARLAGRRHPATRQTGRGADRCLDRAVRDHRRRRDLGRRPPDRRRASSASCR